MQPLTVPQIYNLFQVNEAPYFTLLWQKDLYSKPSVIASFNPDNSVGKEKTTEEKLEAAKKYLDSQLSIYSNQTDAYFQIEMKRTLTSNGEKGVYGPFPFTLNAVQNPSNPLGNIQQPNNMLSMFGLGNDANNMFNSPLGALMELKTQTTIEQAFLKKDKEDFKQEVEDKLKELKEKEEMYDSSVAAAKKGVTLAFFKILKEFGVESETMGKIEGKVKETINNDVQTDPREGTPEFEAVGELAEYVYANFKTVEDIKKLQEFIKVQFVEKQSKTE